MPAERPGHFHVYNQFVIRVPAGARDRLREHLAARKIGTEVYYPIPLHLQACFAALGHRPGDFPEAEAAASQTLALPMYPELTEGALRHVVDSIADFFAASARAGEGPRGLRWARAASARNVEASRPGGKTRAARPSTRR